MWNHVWNFWKLWSTLEFKESFIQYKKTNKQKTKCSRSLWLFSTIQCCANLKFHVSLSVPLSLGVCMRSCFSEFSVVPLCLSILLPFGVFLFYLISIFSFFFSIFLRVGHTVQPRGFVALVLFVSLLLKGCHGFIWDVLCFLLELIFFM